MDIPLPSLPIIMDKSIDSCDGCAPREFIRKPEREANLEADCVDCQRRTSAHPHAKKLSPAPIRYSYERLAMYCSRRIGGPHEVR